jgi:hypothetical protein
MRRLMPALLTSACIAAVAVAAVMVAGTAHHGTATNKAAGVLPTLPGSVNVVRFQKFGGSYQCDGDSCGVSGSVSSNGFTLPVSPTAYTSALTVSFQYRAGGKNARFAVAAHVTRSGTGHHVASTPAQRAVLSTGGGLGTATLVFKPAPLSGNVLYTFEVTPKITHRETRAKIVVTQVVYDLRAWLPAP